MLCDDEASGRSAAHAAIRLRDRVEISLELRIRDHYLSRHT